MWGNAVLADELESALSLDYPSASQGLWQVHKERKDAGWDCAPKHCMCTHTHMYAMQHVNG